VNQFRPGYSEAVHALLSTHQSVGRTIRAVGQTDLDFSIVNWDDKRFDGMPFLVASLKGVTPIFWSSDIPVPEVEEELPIDFTNPISALPTHAGFFYFERPVSLGLLDGKPTAVRCLSFTLMSADRANRLARMSNPLVTLKYAVPGAISAFDEDFRPITLMITEMWPNGRGLEDDDTPPQSDPEMERVIRTIFKMVVYCLEFMQRPIAARTAVVPNHEARKRAKKAGFTPPDIQVVHYRKFERIDPPALPVETDPVGSGREYNYKWEVAGHYRNQRVGPGRMETRRVFVHSYVKGPDGKPMRPSWTKILAVVQ
jgi:hypothetical protein